VTKFDVDPTFDPDDGCYHVSCDWQEVRRPGTVIVEAVAYIHRVDPLDLKPLQAVVDVDSIESILTSQHAAPVTVEFEYADTRVTLSRDGHLAIQVL
jgi:hypothetical protein